VGCIIVLKSLTNVIPFPEPVTPTFPVSLDANILSFLLIAPDGAFLEATLAKSFQVCCLTFLSSSISFNLFWDFIALIFFFFTALTSAESDGWISNAFGIWTPEAVVTVSFSNGLFLLFSETSFSTGCFIWDHVSSSLLPYPVYTTITPFGVIFFYNCFIPFSICTILSNTCTTFS